MSGYAVDPDATPSSPITAPTGWQVRAERAEAALREIRARHAPHGRPEYNGEDCYVCYLNPGDDCEEAAIIDAVLGPPQ